MNITSPPNERHTALRRGLALLVALASDAVSVWIQLVPPLQIGLDLATAALLFAILGFRWPLLPALVVEAIPGLALFPTWTLVVGAMAMLGPRSGAGADREEPKDVPWSATTRPQSASRTDPDRDRT